MPPPAAFTQFLLTADYAPPVSSSLLHDTYISARRALPCRAENKISVACNMLISRCLRRRFLYARFAHECSADESGKYRAVVRFTGTPPSWPRCLRSPAISCACYFHGIDVIDMSPASQSGSAKHRRGYCATISRRQQCRDALKNANTVVRESIGRRAITTTGPTHATYHRIHLPLLDD